MTIKQLKEKMPWIDTTEWVQHENGGGWKHKTAQVPAEVKVPEGSSIGSGASIGNWASIGNGASIGDRTSIGDGASIGDRTSIGNGASIGDKYDGPILYINGSVHPITVCCPSSEIQIGCKRHSREWWLEHFREVGRDQNYTVQQIDEYGLLLDAASSWIDLMLPHGIPDNKEGS